MSHPSWVRGLKPISLCLSLIRLVVAPLVGAWIETHKLEYDKAHATKVAPLVGAWIETRVRQQYTNECIVAPLVGAWIETQLLSVRPSLCYVAPLVGAWIETSIHDDIFELKTSHPSWVRGLKQSGVADSLMSVESHPSWVRGLKQS